MICRFSFLIHTCLLFFFFKQKTAYEMRISDWSSDVCSSDLIAGVVLHSRGAQQQFQWHASPFANSAPTFDTVMAGDLATQRHLPDMSHGEGERAIDQPSDPQPIIREIPFGERRLFRGAGIACSVGAAIGGAAFGGKFTRQRVAIG